VHASSGDSKGGLGGPWPSQIFGCSQFGPPVMCLISRASSFGSHIQQITFSQQYFRQ